MGLVEMEVTTIKGMISDGVKFNFIWKNVFSERQPIHIHQHFEPFA